MPLLPDSNDATTGPFWLFSVDSLARYTLDRRARGLDQRKTQDKARYSLAVEEHLGHVTFQPDGCFSFRIPHLTFLLQLDRYWLTTIITEDFSV